MFKKKMFKRAKGADFAPATRHNTINDGWDTPVTSGLSNESGYDGWGPDPERRTGVALLGQENLGGAATSRAMDSVSGFMTRDTWGPDGRVAGVVGVVERAQTVAAAVHNVTGSGVGRLAAKLPGVGRYVRAAHQGAELATTVSNTIDSLGGAQGIAGGIRGAIRDPWAALEIAANGGGRAVAEGLRAAAGNLAEQSGLGEMTPEGRFQAGLNVGRMATVGAELFTTAGTSGLAMLTEAGAAGATRGLHTAQEYARTVPAELAKAPQREQHGNWGGANWNASTTAATGWDSGAPATVQTVYPDSAW